MQDFTLQHANTFFFITTIAVIVGILILIVILFLAYKIYAFVHRVIYKADVLIEQAAEHTETNPIYKKSLPYILPILGYIFGKKVSTRHKAVKHDK